MPPSVAAMVRSRSDRKKAEYDDTSLAAEARNS
jgi:hypothetical protein